MPAMAPGDIPRSRFFAEPKRVLLTPSASPSVGPPDRPPTKRPRLRSTPSSAISATPSTSNESTSSADVNSARRASTLRVLNTWAQLAERYNKRLDEDDIIDLHRYVIIKDRGAVEGASKEYHIGHFTLDSDQDYPDAYQDQEDSEQDDDENELNVLPPSEATTDDDAPISKKELLRGVPPLSATTDAEDLKDFLEAEKKRKELAGDEGGEEEMSPEQRSALRMELEERVKRRVAAMTSQARDVTSAEPAPDHEVNATPTRPTRALPSDDESEDELALWTHDESTAVYPVACADSEQDVHEVEQEVIELTDSDSNSDEEFKAILTHPPRFIRVSPLPVPQPKEVQSLLQSPPDSERGMSKSRSHSHSKTKSAGVSPKSETRPRPRPAAQKPEIILTRKRKSSVPKETGIRTSDDGLPDTEVVSRISPALKGKGKAIPATVEDTRRKKALKPSGAPSQGRKRNRIVSSSIRGSPSAQSPGGHSSVAPPLSLVSSDIRAVEPKSTLRNHQKSISQNSTLLQPDGSEPTLHKDVSTPARLDSIVGGHSRSLPSSSLASKNQPLPTLSVPAYQSFEPEPVQLTSHDHDSDGHLPSDLPTPVTHSYSQRHPSRPPSIFSSPDQGTSSLSFPAQPPPPVDPVQAQQAHFLLAQAMHQLSYLLSATLPYSAYVSNPGQPWRHPPPPPPSHTTYDTPIHHPPQLYNTRHYHTPSSSIPRSGLPSSSPVRSSLSPPLEGQRARSRGRSKSRGRRVSFKLDSEEVVGREHNTQPEPQHGGQKNHKQILEVKRERGKGRTTEEFNDSLQLDEDRGTPPREVARGRTPGPPSRKRIDAPQGRSLSRR